MSSNLLEVAPAVPAAEGQPSRSAAFKAKKYAEFDGTGTETLHESFESSCSKFADNPCIGYRPTDASGNVGAYTFYTYQETFDKVKAFASSLKAAGVEKKEKVAVFGQNCCEWMIAMQACNRMGFVCVPLYDTLGENAIEYIIDHSESSFIVVAAAKLPAFSKALPLIKTTLKGVVYWGKSPSPEALSAIQDKGLKVTPFEEFQALGAAAILPADPPSSKDLCTIMYTSGTTGDPKGVMLTHEAVVATTKSLIAYLDSVGLAYGTSDSMISYLPLAHIFDRTSEEMFLRLGGSIGYWQGLLPELVNDVAALRPTLFVGVPRVFDRIHQRINDRVAGSGCVKSLLFKWGFNGKLARLNAGFSSENAAPFWDKLVFSKIKATLGGRVRAIVSGGAPLAPHVEEFLKVVMCAPVVQGYGLTETCAASFIATPDDIKHAGTVGQPQPTTTFCLESVPEMKYDALATPSRGELLIKGPNNFSGYYKSDDKTEEVLEPSGWFHTGDIAEVLPEGQIKIIDRKKNIFKLSQGEYVAVEKLEGEYKKTPEVDQIWVYGNSFESCLVCVVVPNKEKLTDWAKSEGLAADDYAALCAKPEAQAHILAAVQAQGKTSKLKGFEIVKAVHLDTTEFNIENDLITPTFKLRRPQLLAYYKEKVDSMYQKLKTA